MKYYILTSHLNVDNIVTSESISPYSYYLKRNFGYKSFEKICDNYPNESIVLYKQICNIQINDIERENHPMVIEIEDDKQLSDLKEIANNVLLCNRTIRITPWNCKFLFFTQKAMILAKMKCDDSKCNKLYSHFIFELVNQSEISNFDISFYDERNSNSDISIDNVDAENHLNRKKGLIYGYVLGKILSMKPETAALLSIQKEIYNYVAALQNSSKADFYIEKIKELDKTYKEKDRNVINLKSLFDNEFDQNTQEKLKKYNSEKYLKVNFAKYHKIPFREESCEFHNLEKYNHEVMYYTENEIKKDKISLNDIQTKDLMDLNNSTFDASLFNHLLKNFFLIGDISIEDIRMKKFDKYKEIASEVKSFMLLKPEDFETEYLTGFLKNIFKSEEFDPTKSQNEELKAIVAFLSKGADYEELIKYMEKYAMTNYDYVLGFWGATTGYVDMSRSILRPIISDKNLFCEFYKKVQEVLFGEKIEFSEFPIKTNIGTSQGIYKETKKTVVTEDSNIIGNQISNNSLKENTNVVTDSVVANKQTPIPSCLKDLFNSLEFKSLPLEAQDWYKKESLSLWKGKNDKTFKNEMKELYEKCPISKTKIKWKNAIKILSQEPNIKENTNLFSDSTTGYFLQDYDFLCNNDEFRNLVSSNKDWEKDLKWFIEAHDPKHRDYIKYYSDKPKDNETIINQFVHLKKDTYIKTESFLKKIYLNKQ